MTSGHHAARRGRVAAAHRHVRNALDRAGILAALRRDRVVTTLRSARVLATPRRERVLVLLAAAYFALAAAGPVLPATADAVGRGRVWLLLTSALAAQGPLPFVQVALAAAVAALGIARTSAVTWWSAALAGHVFSAVIAYALIALAGPADAAATPDYGVSCVLGASLGVLLTVRGDRLSRTVGVAGVLALLPLSFGWIALEHPLAVAIGAGVAVACRPSR